MRSWLWTVLLLSGCSSMLESFTEDFLEQAIQFLSPVVAAVVFSMLTARGVIIIQTMRMKVCQRRAAVQTTVACLLGSFLYAALAVGSAWQIWSAQRLPEPEPLLWFIWPGPATIISTVLLSTAAVVMLVVGGWCAVAKSPEE